MLMSPLIIKNRRTRFSCHFALLDVQNMFLLMFISVNQDIKDYTRFEWRASNPMSA